MTVHQRFNPSAYEFHPELGYLCPSRQLRQNVRVGLAAAAFGLVAGTALAIVMLPRHDVTRSEPVLVVSPSGPLGGSTSATASSPSVTASSPSIASPPAERVSTDSIAKQPPAAPAAPANATPVETPARAAPAVPAERSVAAVGGSEPVRAVASKRTRTARSTARRRAREPAPSAAFAASPFSFQTSRFADETRSQQRRREGGGGWGGGWSW
jgi:hypothetical protein